MNKEILYKSVYCFYKLTHLFSCTCVSKYITALCETWNGSKLKSVAKHAGIVRLKSKPNLLIEGELNIGDHFCGGRYLRINLYSKYLEQAFSPVLTIGNDVSFEDYCHIGCINKITIGDGCLIASKVFITDHYHGEIKSSELRPAVKPLYSKGEVTIGKNVWIGDNVCIMPGVSIGDNCIIGAGSVITKSFPENTVIAGIPAKIIKYI